MRTLGASAAERIKATFNKYDTSKDGTLDAVELKVLTYAYEYLCILRTARSTP